MKSFYIFLINRPIIIFGMGGYSSFPICLAAKILGIKFVIYENNLIIGKANKYLSAFAKKIFLFHIKNSKVFLKKIKIKCMKLEI